MHGNTPWASMTSTANKNRPRACASAPTVRATYLNSLYLQAAEQDLVVHAMPLRPVFRTYLTGERP